MKMFSQSRPANNPTNLHLIKIQHSFHPFLLKIQSFNKFTTFFSLSTELFHLVFRFSFLMVIYIHFWWWKSTDNLLNGLLGTLRTAVSKAVGGRGKKKNGKGAKRNLFSTFSFACCELFIGNKSLFYRF